MLGVVGRNGAGKSTLLKVLSRITEPTLGRIELRGRVASLLEVGTGFHPDLTGRENIYLNGAILGMPRADLKRKFDAIVEFAEVAKFLDTPVKHYSSGMYLRLAFSVAAHLDGEILLVDEVLAVGDMAFQQKCLGKMKDVSLGGRTVLFITHNMAAVSALCTRAMVMDGGRPVFDGPAADAVRYYLESNLADSAATWDLADLSRRSDDLAALVHIERVSASMGRPDGSDSASRSGSVSSSAPPSSWIRWACALGLDDMYGTRVVTFDSGRQAAPIATVSGGHYAIDLEIPPFGLLPGKYLLSVSVYSGGQFHDYLIHFGAVSVVPIEQDGGGLRRSGDWSGRDSGTGHLPRLVPAIRSACLMSPGFPAWCLPRRVDAQRSRAPAMDAQTVESRRCRSARTRLVYPHPHLGRFVYHPCDYLSRRVFLYDNFERTELQFAVGSGAPGRHRDRRRCQHRPLHRCVRDGRRGAAVASWRSSRDRRRSPNCPRPAVCSICQTSPFSMSLPAGQTDRRFSSARRASTTSISIWPMAGHTTTVTWLKYGSFGWTKPPIPTRSPWSSSTWRVTRSRRSTGPSESSGTDGPG